MTNEIVLIESENADITLPVSISDDTVWLSTSLMSQLFEKDESTIRKHMRNILKNQCLMKNGACKKCSFLFLLHNFGLKILIFLHTFQLTNTLFYTLDGIISVEYRVKSKRGAEFRK